MSHTLWKYTLREVQRRPGRALLTLLGIVIGVAMVVAIVLTTQTTRHAYHEMFDALGGKAALEVVAQGLGGFDPTLADRCQAPGVVAAVPVIQTPAVLRAPSGPVTALALGIDPARDAAARTFTLREGHNLTEADGVLLEAGFARAHGFTLGRAVPLLTLAGAAEVPVVGLLEPRGGASFNGGAVLYLRLARAQKLFALPGRINSVQLVLADGAAPGPVEAELRRRLPQGFVVQVPGARSVLSQDSLYSIHQPLNTVSMISLVAGAFVVLNSFLMNLNERRKQLAILRSLGATRRQVTRLLLREAVLLGGVGTLLGSAAGVGLALALRGVFEQLLALPLPPLRLGPLPFVLAAVVGPGMALLATVVPARRAARRPPLEELAPSRQDRVEASRRWPSYLGLGLVALTLVLTLGLLYDWYPPEAPELLLPPLMAGLMGGSVLALRLLLPALLGLTGRLLRPLLGAEGRIALRHLERHPGRTALTVGVLFIAVVCAVSFGQTLQNQIRDMNDWFQRTIVADFLVRGSNPDPSLLAPTAIPEHLGERIAALEGVERVDKVSFVLGHIEGRPALLLARTFTPGQPLRLDLREGDVAEVIEGLLRGEVVVAIGLARKLGRGVGDTVTLETSSGPRRVRIAGLVNEYTTGGMAVYLGWEAGQRLLGLQGVHAFEVAARPGEGDALTAQLQALCDREGLLLQSNREIRETVDRSIGSITGFLWVLIALVFVVASLGIVNTLTMNVLEQTRELGVLRAIGMQRRQVRKLVLAQALGVGILSLVPGVALGLLVAYLMTICVDTILGHPAGFQLDSGFVAGCAAAALATAVLAALTPARRAARLEVIQALHYE
jgi:putative ABC transport system permease protein